MTFSCLTAIVCKIADTDTPAIIIIRNTFTDHFTGSTAGTASYTDLSFIL